MKKNSVTFLLVILSFLSLYSQDKIKVAVLEFKILNVNMDIAEAVYDEFIVRLIDSGKFIVAEREDLKKVMQEMALQNTDEFDESSSVEIGKYLGSQVVIFGKLQKIGQKIRISIKGVDVKSATATFAKIISVDNEDLILDNIPLLISQIIEETTAGNNKEEQKIINKEKQLKIEEINSKISNLKEEMRILEEKNKNNKSKISGSLIGMGVSWGLFGLTAIGTGIGFGLMAYYYDLNIKSETISLIEQYSNFGSNSFGAGLACSIISLATLIPSIVLTGYYVHISGFNQNIDRKRKDLQKLEIELQKITFFDFKINNDNLTFSFLIKL